MKLAAKKCFSLQWLRQIPVRLMLKRIRLARQEDIILTSLANTAGPVQTLLKKVAALSVLQTICPSGPVLTENLEYYINLLQRGHLEA